ncbi:hypothetical protein VNO80_28613 [Phaseolus coccineus]|uniref:Uncharacterized protein n=1 Tax=Phaseolus coccineus TaxID=3886 RepID=A0AAN9L9D7_PHACN
MGSIWDGFLKIYHFISRRQFKFERENHFEDRDPKPAASAELDKTSFKSRLSVAWISSLTNTHTVSWLVS